MINPFDITLFFRHSKVNFSRNNFWPGKCEIGSKVSIKEAGITILRQILVDFVTFFCIFLQKLSDFERFFAGFCIF